MKTFSLKAVAGLVGVSFLLASCMFNDEEKDAGTLIVASYGGYWQEVLQESMFKPYAQEKGIQVLDEIYNGAYQPLMDQATNGATQWDLVNVETNMVIQGEIDGIVEEIDYRSLNVNDFIPEAKHSHGVGVMTWSWVLAYNTVLFGANPPSSWADFFDVKTYPGSRGLQKDPRRVLEAALLADGVIPANLYPLDVDRALTKLEKLNSDLAAKGDALVWWDSYARPQELLANGTVVMTPGTNGRINQALEAGGVNFHYTWEQGIIDLDWWVIMKDSPSKSAAMKFLQYASSVEAQREMAIMISYGPVNTKALESLPENIRRKLPTHPANLDKQFFFDAEWWGKNYDTVIVRWDSWLSGL